jgi:imidazole glycerol-phosphate synthase subunit HisH
VIAVVDYGMGNLHSMAKAIEHIGEDVEVTSEPVVLERADRIVLPGVGAFGECMANLRASGLVDVLSEQVLGRRKPFLGVCVGMQLLARTGLEHGSHEGLGWVAGTVRPLVTDDPDLRIPHTGWSEVSPGAADGSPLDGVRPGEAFYFNHSYHLVPDDPDIVAARCDHGGDVVAAIMVDNLFATQFHPEKSQQAGLEVLAGFSIWEPAATRS